VTREQGRVSAVRSNDAAVARVSPPVKGAKRTTTSTTKLGASPPIEDRDHAEEAAMRVESRHSGVIDDDERARARVQWPLYCPRHMEAFLALLARRGVCVSRLYVVLWMM
jgi:hypothetical protein